MTPAREGAALGAALATAALLAGCGGGGSEPAGGLIAFARAPAGGGGVSAIQVVDGDGTVRALTGGSVDRAPAWSPDGRRLAFLRSRGGGQPSVHVLELDGGVRALPDAAADEVAWSPDGTRLLLVDGDTLAVVDADGSGREVVAESASGVKDAAWSPDGGTILFTGGGGGLQTDLFAVEPGRAGTIRLTRLPYESGGPSGAAWSPSGDRIAFLLPGGVHVMGSDGSEQTALVRVPEGAGASSLAWSPDGETIAYTLAQLGGPPAASGVFVVAAAGGEPRRLTEAVDVGVAWSPDGRRLVVQRFTGFQRSRIVEIDPETGAARPLTGGHSDTGPAWQPPGG